MKTRKNRRGVSTIIAVLLMIIITVAAAVIVWAFLSGYIGSRTAPTTQQSVIQINAIDRSATAVASVQLVTRGSNATIVGVYVNGAPAAGFTPNAAKFSSTATTGTIVTISFTGPLNVGDVVKVVCADGGAASLAAT
jgi:FlaG/FlaF family flagellin (archaellin)